MIIRGKKENLLYKQGQLKSLEGVFRFIQKITFCKEFNIGDINKAASETQFYFDECLDFLGEKEVPNAVYKVVATGMHSFRDGKPIYVLFAKNNEGYWLGGYANDMENIIDFLITSKSIEVHGIIRKMLDKVIETANSAGKTPVKIQPREKELHLSKEPTPSSSMFVCDIWLSPEVKEIASKIYPHIIKPAVLYHNDSVGVLSNSLRYTLQRFHKDLLNGTVNGYAKVKNRQTYIINTGLIHKNLSFIKIIATKHEDSWDLVLMESIKDKSIEGIPISEAMQEIPPWSIDKEPQPQLSIEEINLSEGLLGQYSHYINERKDRLPPNIQCMDETTILALFEAGIAKAKKYHTLTGNYIIRNYYITEHAVQYMVPINFLSTPDKPNVVLMVDTREGVCMPTTILPIEEATMNLGQLYPYSRPWFI